MARWGHAAACPHYIYYQRLDNNQFLGFYMFEQFTQFIKIFSIAIHSANKIVTPMYKFVVCLGILITGLILKNLGLGSMTGIIYVGAICSFIMLFKASFHYYWKSRKLEKKLEGINK